LIAKRSKRDKQPQRFDRGAIKRGKQTQLSDRIGDQTKEDAAGYAVATASENEQKIQIY
jgi:hypothetical protein